MMEELARVRGLLSGGRMKPEREGGAIVRVAAITLEMAEASASVMRK